MTFAGPPSLPGTLRGPPGPLVPFGGPPMAPPPPPLPGTLSGSPFPPGAFAASSSFGAREAFTAASMAGTFRGAPPYFYGGEFGPPTGGPLPMASDYTFGMPFYSSEFKGNYPAPYGGPFRDRYRDYGPSHDDYDYYRPRRGLEAGDSYLDDKDPDFLNDPDYCRVTRILPYLYLTNKTGVCDSTLQSLGITCVVGASESHELQPPRYPCDFRRIPVPNDPTSRGPNIIKYFDEVADLIHRCERGGGRVLVHSLKGRSRGPTLVIAYLMKYERMTLSESFAMVSGQRHIIRPFYSFWKQLITYEKELYGRSSAAF